MQSVFYLALKGYAHVVQHRSMLTVLSLIVIGVYALMISTGTEGSTAATAVRIPSPAPDTLQAAPPAPAVDSAEVLWLARAIYSETKQPHEQELVAWAIRNRVDTRYRGERSYREVVLDPWQFSAFNRNSPKRRYYSNLSLDSNPPGFQRAIEIAHRVANAPDSTRPFPESTRHFYSERSMVAGRTPRWAANKRPVNLDRHVDPRRFRFYAGVH